MGFALLLGMTKTFACVCALMPDESLRDAVKRNVRESTIVFAGQVIGFEYRRGIPNEYMDSREKESGRHIGYGTLVVKFKVKTWWKGDVAPEIVLVTDVTRNSDGTTTNSSCNYDYRKRVDYLVFASGKVSELRTNYCSRTRPLAEAKEDLQVLGKGKEPVEFDDLTESKVRSGVCLPEEIEKRFINSARINLPLEMCGETI